MTTETHRFIIIQAKVFEKLFTWIIDVELMSFSPYRPMSVVNKVPQVTILFIISQSLSCKMSDRQNICHFNLKVQLVR